jgi:hypothetical protein
VTAKQAFFEKSAFIPSGLIETVNCIVIATDAVTNTELMPRMSVIDAGQDVTCSANANPPPVIKMKVEVNGQVEEESVTSKWRMMSKWAGNKVKVTCTASNIVDGQPHVDQYDKEYDVKGEFFFTLHVRALIN